MKNIFIPLAFLLLLSSCSGKIIQSSSTIEKDSVFVDTVHHKKIIKEKGDSVGAVIQLPQTLINRTKTLTSPKEEEVISFTAEDPIVFKQEVKKGRLTESVTISQKGKLTVTCKEDSLRNVIDQLIINSKNFKTKIVTTTKTIEVAKPPTGFQSFCKWFTIFIITAIMGVTIYKLRKLIPI